MLRRWPGMRLLLHSAGFAGSRCLPALPLRPYRQGWLAAAAAHSSSGSQGSDELLSKLKDKELLKTLGYVGGEWTQASDGSTYSVRPYEQYPLSTSRHWSSSSAKPGRCDIQSNINNKHAEKKDASPGAAFFLAARSATQRLG